MTFMIEIEQTNTKSIYNCNVHVPNSTPEYVNGTLSFIFKEVKKIIQRWFNG